MHLVTLSSTLKRQFEFSLSLSFICELDIILDTLTIFYLMQFFSWFNIFLTSSSFGFKLAVRVGIIYLLSGLGGNILSALFLQNSISVGASGALFGLLGAMLSELLINWTIYSNKVSCLV